MLRGKPDRFDRQSISGHFGSDQEAFGGQAALIDQSRSSGRLNLSDKNLKVVPEQLFSPATPALSKKVDLSFDRSGDEQNWWEVTELTRLIVANNVLEELDERIGEFGALTVLDARNNRLQSVPDQIGDLQSLTHLNLSGNLLSSIPSAIVSLSALRDLTLANNKITTIPPIGHLPNLTALDLSSNALSTLPSDIDRLTSLRKLLVNSNRLTDLGAGITRLISLQELDASENHLSSIFTVTSSSASLPNLQILNVRRNRLVSILNGVDGGVVQCANLKELLVSFNALRDVDSGFLEAADEVETLDLADNALATLPSGVLGLKGLKRLDISNNAITKLPPGKMS
ncbi:hypothetical protein HDV00_008421 [Rhizophlyctis rosea]|nr:hypothetical protein HDV00_008421 [Rhizophlyctis rosea]